MSQYQNGKNGIYWYSSKVADQEGEALCIFLVGGVLMCGIAGFCNFDADFLQDTESWTQVLAGMRTAIAHRGHDQTGEYLQRHVGLSHTRLSIRDLLGGAQPMLRQRGNREYGIVYNGEIYNAEELKQDLLSRGCRFETTCDTEVILCGYMEYGMEVAKSSTGFMLLQYGTEILTPCFSAAIGSE